MQQEQVNDNLVLLCGKSAAGKSASLMGLENPEGVMYLNCEAGKKLPFRSKFKEYVITDPMQVEEAFEVAETLPDIHTIVIDSLTYLMDMYESLYVINASNTMKAWGEFAQYFKRVMQQHVAGSSKNVVFIAHTKDTLNEGEMVMETAVPIKGSVKNNGVESYFSCIIAAKKVKLKDLEAYGSDLLTVTPEEEALGFKYVFQTKLTKETVNERLRGPLGLWDTKETFIDNNMQLVFNRLHEYYA
ncbi:AAA family ATPase [uncultured Marinobacter sp.]|uniref:AAA family ATPase n=1 Tax=uncultured Marinobacter sp. TaxID=187379 RepID=UPI0025979463|nr:AAA family ATPase [uncultured Marinobacter sp.]